MALEKYVNLYLMSWRRFVDTYQDHENIYLVLEGRFDGVKKM